MSNEYCFKKYIYFQVLSGVNDINKETYFKFFHYFEKGKVWKLYSNSINIFLLRVIRVTCSFFLCKHCVRYVNVYANLWVMFCFYSFGNEYKLFSHNPLL